MTGAEFTRRIELVLAFHATHPGIEESVMREVEAFFAAHPQLARSEFTAGIVAHLVFERLSAAQQQQTK